MNENVISIKAMRDYGFDVRTQVASVFVDAYYKEMSVISKNKAILEETFKDAFNEDVIYLAELEGEIVGMLACANNQQRAMRIELSRLRKSLGFLKGSITYLILNKEFNTQLLYPADTTYIECVATKEKARGKGVATKLFKYAMNELNYTHYVLEVIDINPNAYRLYEKLGFKVMKRVKERFPKIKGFNERIYMEWTRVAKKLS